MNSRRHSVLSVTFTLILAIPIYLITQMQTGVNQNDWEALQRASVDFLIGLWSCWLITATIAVYYKWTEKRNFFFWFNYAYLTVAFLIFAHYNDQLFRHIDLSERPYGKNMLNAIRTLRNALPIFVATVYLQVAVRWFENKWHRK
ncbi:hypothetical protein RQM65_02680 [Pricia sp. S334]|uniref:Uncharacterized protein n=1 Tax=Pricia mediterranea TaxID=3076079 RepID=A0ABU3L1G5_9FLAO|nr:hypothetical protein [Pricia sp. S334]MDT7827569.1 hypothetical protein [Pricia sp. S334]